MKPSRVLLICLAGGLVWSTLSRADDAVQPGNPYGAIVKRNVFGLNPIPVVDPNAPPPGPPPPKITLTGVMTIFGVPEALFKVSGVVRQGRPPQDESYIFVEGEGQDDVEVTNIDTQKNIVTFINHGVVQTIPLASGVASTGEMPPSPTFAPGRFGRRFGRPGGTPGSFQPYTPPTPNGQPYGNGNGYNSGNDNSGTQGFGNNGSYNNSSVHNNNAYISPAVSQLSAEDQDALVAAQHAQMEANHDPNAIIMPPTQFDNDARQELKGGSSSGNANPNP